MKKIPSKILNKKGEKEKLLKSLLRTKIKVNWSEQLEK